METKDEHPEQPLINFAGEKVAVGPRRHDLIPLYTKWFNDFEVIRTLSGRLKPATLESEEAWYSRNTQSEQEVVFTIYERATMRPIGNTGLHKIDHRNRTAEFGILIGEKDCWGKGYGTEVASLMLDYGFNGLGLHCISLQVFGYNERGVRAYTRAGFKVAGRIRESRRLADIAYDTIIMDCLAAEFRSPVLRDLLLG